MSGAEDVDRAYAGRGDAPSRRGASTTPAERQKALLKIADALESRADEFVAIESKDTGKPLGLTASEELPPCVDQLRFFAGAARLLEGRSAGEYMTDHTSYVRREPIGVVGQVTPWNYPLMMMIWKIAPALAAGNTLVLKPSDTTPASSTLLAAAVPRSSCRPACSTSSAATATPVARVVEHPIPQMVSITGSVRAGMQVAASAAADLKRTHLELGGKAPVVVFDDADLAKAAEDIAVAGYFNAGQDCTAATRVLAGPGHPRRLRRGADRAGQGHQHRAARRRGRALRRAQQRRPARPGHRHGRPAAGPRQPRRPAARARATSATSTSRPCCPGSSRTTSRSRTRSSARSSPSSGSRDEAEALRWANGVKYGLASSVWTKDHGRAMRMAKGLDFGCVWINTHIPIVAEMPHGGFKHSGYGKDLSMYGLEDYTRIKHVMSYIGE